MKINYPILLGSKEWKQVCGNNNFSNIKKLSDFDKRRLIRELTAILSEDEQVSKKDTTQLKQSYKKYSTKKRKYTKQSKIVELFEQYYYPSITKTKAYEIIGKKLGIKSNSVREAIRRYNEKVKKL